MFANLFTLVSTILNGSLMSFDYLLIFNSADDNLYAITPMDVANGASDKFILVKKVSQLVTLGQFKLLAVDAFESKYPDSGLERFSNSLCAFNQKYRIEYYLASYIHLFKRYKSLKTLVSNGHSELVRTFIDYCIDKNTDHPTSISYNEAEIHKVLKLRKSVYMMFKNNLDDHDTFVFIQDLALRYRYRDEQFRDIRKKIREKQREETKSISKNLLIHEIKQAEERAMQEALISRPVENAGRDEHRAISSVETKVA